MDGCIVLRFLQSFAMVKCNMGGCLKTLDERGRHENMAFLSDENLTIYVTVCS
jgi:hypothetical protein